MGILGIAYAHGRSLFSFIVLTLTRKYVTKITVSEGTTAGYECIILWINRLLEKTNKNKYDVTLTNKDMHNELVVRSGFYLIKSEFGYLWISSVLKQPTSTGYSSAKELQVISISFLSRNKSKIERHILEMVENKDVAATRGIYKVINDYEGGRLCKVFEDSKKRNLISPFNIEELENELLEFNTKKSWYKDKDITHKKIVLLAGKPGNGKTSTVKHIARSMGYSIAVADINTVSPETFINFLNYNTRKVIFLMEDIDRSATVTKVEDDDDEPTNKTKPTIDIKSLLKDNLNKLLNLFDGVTTPEGIIVFMTCNNIEKLDPAFIRPGRVDKVIYYKDASPEQARLLFLKFFPGEDEKADAFSKAVPDDTYSMSTLQQFLFKYKTAEQAILGLDTLSDEKRKHNQ